MDIVAQEKKNNKRYMPHTVSTKEGAVKLYRQTKDIDFVLRRHNISKASLMRWNRLYDGTKESITKKSKHPGHYDTPTELGKKWQMNMKYVPAACYVGTDGEKFHQYTMI